MSSVTAYALKENHPLLVEVTGDGNNRYFKLTVKQYREKIKKYCAWFETTTVSKTYDDWSETVRLGNGIEFNVYLY